MFELYHCPLNIGWDPASNHVALPEVIFLGVRTLLWAEGHELSHGLSDVVPALCLPYIIAGLLLALWSFHEGAGQGQDCVAFTSCSSTFFSFSPSSENLIHGL